MRRNRKKMSKVTMSLNEGWDARGNDKVLHYWVKNRGICNVIFRYHPPYFDPGYIPDNNEKYDYCEECLKLLRYRIKVVDTRRFIL